MENEPDKKSAFTGNIDSVKSCFENEKAVPDGILKAMVETGNMVDSLDLEHLHLERD